MKYLIVFLIALFLSGCSKESNNPVTPVADGDIKFGIYFLKDSSLKIKYLFQKDLSTFELQPDAWISDKDIEFYDWSSHLIYLKKSKSSFFPSVNGQLSIPDSWDFKPFVLASKDKKFLAGYFQPIWTNEMWPFANMLDFDLEHYYPDDIVYLDWPFFPAEDRRQNEEMKAYLKSINLLHEGIKLTIDSLFITNNSDTATIRYNYTVRNMDSDNLYVLDPDKMGTNLYHYFTNGVVFYNDNEKILYESRYKTLQPDPFDSYDSKWFTKIESGKTISRSVVLKGYPHLPSGLYYFKLNFGSPINISRQNRQLSDGRYWIGDTSSETMACEIGQKSNQSARIRTVSIHNNNITQKNPAHLQRKDVRKNPSHRAY
ncbi:MAG: hypothetical protein ACM3SM_14955 [Bacteroidota bacterium]